MAETLFLYLPLADQAARWLPVDTLGNRIGRVQQGGLADASVAARGRRLRVLVPGVHVSLLRTSVPTRNPQKLLQAVPFALEDSLAEDIESLHFAIGPRDADGCSVAVLLRNCLEQWLKQLADAELKADELVPDMLALPARPAALTLALDEDMLRVRMPDGACFAAELPLASVLLVRQLARLRTTLPCDKAVLHTTPQADTAALLPVLEQQGLDTQLIEEQDGLLPLFAATLHNRPAVNLLQGTFAPRKAMGEHWRRWRLAAGLLIAFCLAGIAQQAIVYYRLQREAAQLDAAVLDSFHRALPDVRRVVDVRAQMQQRLNQLSGGNGNADALPMLMVLGTALQTAGSVQLDGFSYRDGTLQVQVQAKQIQSLNELKSALQQAGTLRVSLDSVSSTADRATGRLTLSGGVP